MTATELIKRLAFTGADDIPGAGTWAVKCDGCGREMNWDGSPAHGTGYLLFDTNPESVNIPTFSTIAAAFECARSAGWDLNGEHATCPECRRPQ